MREDFQKWLKGDAPMMTVADNNKVDFYFKAKRDDRFDIIFWQHGDRDGALQMCDLEYSGLYDRVSKKIFDAQHTLRTIAVSWGYDEKTSYESIPSAFAKDVRLRINGIIDNDRDNLTIKSESQLKDYNAISRLSDREWRSGEESKRLFFAGRTPDDVIYDSHYKISEYDSNSFISKNDYLNIISDYDGAVERFARRWIENNQESIFADFLINDDIKGSLQDIIDDKENPLHYIRAIINSVKDTDCKTVNVTIVKDGKELTFKTDADVMKRDCGSYYGTHHIHAQDRRVFEETYGRYSNYCPMDVVQISYGKKILYNRNSFRGRLMAEIQESEQAFSEGMGGMGGMTGM